MEKLEKLQEAKELKEQVNATQQREAVPKARLGPWMDEAYVLTTTIEENLTNLQRTQQKIWGVSAGPTMEQLVEQVKQAAIECIAEVAVVQVDLVGLHNKISPTTY